MRFQFHFRQMRNKEMQAIFKEDEECRMLNVPGGSEPRFAESWREKDFGLQKWKSYANVCSAYIVDGHRRENLKTGVCLRECPPNARGNDSSAPIRCGVALSY